MANKHEAEEANAIEKINDNLSSATEKIANNKKVIYWIIGGILVIAVFIVSYLYIYRNHVGSGWLLTPLPSRRGWSGSYR